MQFPLVASAEISCQPLLKWPGGKRGELPWIRPLIPPHNRYFEPFFGGGSVFFDAISAPSFANDIHPDLMMFYSCIQSQNSQFFRLLTSYAHEWERGTLERRQDMYYRARALYNALPAASPESAAIFFLIRQLAYAGMFRVNADGAFNVPFGRAYGFSGALLRRKVEYLQSPVVQEKMRLLSLSVSDFEEFLDSFEITENDFLFMDPRTIRRSQGITGTSPKQTKSALLNGWSGRRVSSC